MNFFTRYGKSFRLLFQAARNCKHDMWQALQLLLLVTLVLAVFFYAVESYAQPAEYGNPLKVLVWALTQYIGDPGSFAGPGPVTFAGRLIATVIGIIKILIFAVPAGMIGSGFSQAIKDDSRLKKFYSDRERIRKCFMRTQCRHTNFRVTVPYKSLVSLQVELGMNDSDIISAVSSSASDDLRLCNLADTYSMDKNVPDKLVVEHFPLQGLAQDGAEMIKTGYGCKIDRKSNVTIVSTGSNKEIGNSHFAYYLSLYGGFNYISREFGKGSFYIPDENTLNDARFKSFKNDLEELSGRNKNKAWTIFILQVPRDLKSQISFVHQILPKLQAELGFTETVLKEKEEVFLSAYHKVADMLRFGGDSDNGGYAFNKGELSEPETLHADLDTCFRGVGKRNISMHIGAGQTTNAFTLRIAARIIARDRINIPIAARMAEIFRTAFEPDKSFDVQKHNKICKEDGFGYTLKKYKK